MAMIIAVVLLAISIYGVLYHFCRQFFGIGDEPKLRLDASERPLELQEAIDYYAKKKIDRALLPLSEKLKIWEQRLPKVFGSLRLRLVKAGSPVNTLEFLILKIFCLVAVPVVSFVFLRGMFSRDILLISALAAGFFLPEIWLNGQIRKRQASIRRDLPNVIDLLNLCVSGGLDFMLAVNRVVRDLKPCALTKELGEVYRETQMGKTRREALKNFAGRVDMPEAHSFVRTLVQADRMGTPMSEALGLQSEEMRVRRFQNGESMALKAPIKLLFPLFAFILPVVLIIVGGPIILQFTRGSMQVGF
jgi:tight adherence protein C